MPLPRDTQQHLDGELELLSDRGEDLVAQLLISNQAGIEARDAQVRLRDAKLDIAQHQREQRKALHHLSKQFLLSRSVIRESLQRMAHAEPRGHAVTALHPAEHPGNRAKVLKLVTAAA